MWRILLKEGRPSLFSDRLEGIRTSKMEENHSKTTPDSTLRK
jgi:hypothetical protein